jgi:hypothetical protein
MTINAIETEYAGCRFRSRLEARWAVFFDALRIPWDYELQGYQLGEAKRPYLPDFYLPAAGTWVEVKGEMSRLDVGLLDDAVNYPAGLPHPNPWGELTMLILGPVPEPDGAYVHTMLSRTVYAPCEKFCACRDLQFRQVAFHAISRAAEKAAGFPDESSFRPPGALLTQVGRSELRPLRADVVTAWRSGLVNADPLVLDAYRAARSARFEHGEMPALPANAGPEPVPVGAPIRERIEALRADHPGERA